MVPYEICRNFRRRKGVRDLLSSVDYSNIKASNLTNVDKRNNESTESDEYKHNKHEKSVLNLWYITVSLMQIVQYTDNFKTSLRRVMATQADILVGW